MLNEYLIRLSAKCTEIVSECISFIRDRNNHNPKVINSLKEMIALSFFIESEMDKLYKAVTANEPYASSFIELQAVEVKLIVTWQKILTESLIDISKERK